MKMIDDDEVDLKKSQKTLDTIKDYINMRPEAPGVWAN